MSTYDGFTLNDPTTPAPWGPVEKQAWQDMADTVTKDTVQTAKDVAGHKHSSVYNYALQKAINANSGAGIDFGVQQSGDSSFHDLSLTCSSATPVPGFSLTAFNSDGISFVGPAGVCLTPWDSNNAPHPLICTGDSNGYIKISSTGNDKLFIQSNSSGDAMSINNTVGGGGCEINFNGTFIKLTCTHLTVTSLPTSSSGLPPGTLWNSSGTVKVA